MTVLRIVANIQTADPAALSAFYGDVFGLTVVMDHGFIVTLAAQANPPAQIRLAQISLAQIRLARDGGSGTAMPALSIKVDDLDATPDRAWAAGAVIDYGPVIEPWGGAAVLSARPRGPAAERADAPLMGIAHDLYPRRL